MMLNAECKHEAFSANVGVDKIEDINKTVASIRITCSDCGVPMRFIGLPAGMDLNGACVSADGEEGRFAIAPRGEVINVIEGARHGFTIRKNETDDGLSFRRHDQE